MGFADLAIDILKNNKRLRRKPNYFKSYDFRQNQADWSSQGRKEISEQALARAKAIQRKNAEMIIALLFICLVAAGVISWLLFF